MWFCVLGCIQNFKHFKLNLIFINMLHANVSIRITPYYKNQAVYQKKVDNMQKQEYYLERLITSICAIQSSNTYTSNLFPWYLTL